MNCHIAYHKEHEHGQFEGDCVFVSRDVNVQAGSCLYVIEGKKQGQSRVTYFLTGRYSVSGKKRNPGFIEGNKSPKHKEFKLELTPIASPAASIRLNDESDFDNDLFHKHYTSGQDNCRRISETTVTLGQCFERLLESTVDNESSDLEIDLQALESDPQIPNETERAELRKARIGQGKFKSNTIRMWGGEPRCALTGVTVPQLLIASHIKPWRESDNVERLAGWNGIILCAHVDRLFDKHLLGFKRTGPRATYVLEFSRELKSQPGSLEKIGIKPGLQLDLEQQCQMAERHRLEQMLDEHLERVRSK